MSLQINTFKDQFSNQDSVSHIEYTRYKNNTNLQILHDLYQLIFTPDPDNMDSRTSYTSTLIFIQHVMLVMLSVV